MQMKQLLESALQSLPEGNRRVYEMRDLEDQSGEKVAEALGISLAAMKSRLHRARDLLRERIDAVLKGNGKSVG
jgi:RNA polymerase sigma-70 factor (ECF subfamily)